MKAKFYYQDKNAPKPNMWGIGAIAIIEQQGKVLVDKRADCDEWAFFGGQPEIDEEIRHCIRREMLEETGLIVKEEKFIGVFCNPSRIAEYPDGNIRRGMVLVFKVAVEDAGIIRLSDESIDYRWLDRQELKNWPLIATHLPIRDHYLSLTNETGDKWLID